MNYLLFGVLGGLAFTTADWLIFFGNATPVTQKYSYLFKGLEEIAPWRYNMSMVLSFISVIVLGIGLFSLEIYIPNPKHKIIFHYLNVLNLTTWSTLHMAACYQEAVSVFEAIFLQFQWVVPTYHLFITYLIKKIYGCIQCSFAFFDIIMYDSLTS
ncbi:hypothetical protein H8356DRAFT_1353559 [Neocallimastix lanati (nom. inval.)]|nr:hypothetical protein H8356DRAFT_1353559 [Neocallimastix sp. JGI-2020a]